MSKKHMIAPLIGLVFLLLFGCDATDDLLNKQGDEDTDDLTASETDTQGELTDEPTVIEDGDVSSEEEAETLELQEYAIEDGDEAWESEFEGESEETSEEQETDEPKAFEWYRLPITIEDDVIEGSYVWSPIDAIAYAQNDGGGEFVTMYNQLESYAWFLEEETGAHYKRDIAGETFAQGEDFCGNGESDWCQFIGYDPLQSTYVVLGPWTSSVMSLTPDTFTGTLFPIVGDNPDVAINYTHVFDWHHRMLFQYGLTSRAGRFGDKLYRFDMDNHDWRVAANGLQPIDDNCIAYDPSRKIMLSFGGRMSEDGNGSSIVNTYQIISLSANESSVGILPETIGYRHNMSCAYDARHDLFFVFGGCNIQDNWDARENTFYNDLWRYDPATGEWENLLPNTEGGEVIENNFGDFVYEADDTKPNFGRNRGKMMMDEVNNRLILVGAIPPYDINQVFFLYLDSLNLVETDAYDEHECASNEDCPSAASCVMPSFEAEQGYQFCFVRCVEGCNNNQCPGTYDFCTERHGECSEVPCFDDEDCLGLGLCDLPNSTNRNFYCDEGRCRRR